MPPTKSTSSGWARSLRSKLRMRTSKAFEQQHFPRIAIANGDNNGTNTNTGKRINDDDGSGGPSDLKAALMGDNCSPY